MPKRVRVVALIALLFLSLTGAASAGDFDVRYLLATVGCAFLVITYRKFGKLETKVADTERDRLRWQDRVDGALYGPEEPNGVRNGAAGIVSLVRGLAKTADRIVAAAEASARHSELASRAAQDAAAFAATAASAAQTAQKIISEERRK